MTQTIALDAMGGDHGVAVVVPAAAAALCRHPSVRLILVGDEGHIQDALAQCGAAAGERLRIVHASQQVGMDEPPSQALRYKKDSSMRVALELVKRGEADACVSAGNTGALMATARYVLKTLPGIDRPAICTALPTTQGHCHVLDLGANVDSTPENLFQFAVMGSVLASAVDNNPSPRIGLLNIGEEDIKGNEKVKGAAELLAASDLDYAGFVEGDGIFNGEVDVVVCDGFEGNVALKASEGVAKMIAHFLRESFQSSWYGRLAALVAAPVLKRFKDRIDPRQYNGASLVGLRGIVIKSHGGADEIAFGNAISVAVTEVEKQVPQRISQLLSRQLQQRQAV